LRACHSSAERVSLVEAVTATGKWPALIFDGVQLNSHILNLAIWLQTLWS